MPINSLPAPYVQALRKWTRCRDVIGGGDAVKAKRTEYLPLLEGHRDVNDLAYIAYLHRAEFYNATARTVVGMSGAVFRRPPTVQAPSVVDHLRDITRSGHPLETFAATTFTDIMSVGRGGILVDMPPEGTPDARPYWVFYTAEQIINYRTTVHHGVRVLTRVVLRETREVDTSDPWVSQTEDQYRELVLADGAYEQRLYRKLPNKDEWVQVEVTRPVRLGRPLPFIPWTFINTGSIEPEIENPAILDLVDVNLSHFRTSADYEHGAHFTALPTPWVVGAPLNASLKIGAGTAWILNETPHSKAEMLEYTGQGLGALEKLIDRKEKRMAVLGARLLEAQATMTDTATAVRMRQSGDESILKRMANAVSAALTKSIRTHVWWAGSTQITSPEILDARVTLNTDFIETTLTGPELTALVGAFQSGALSFSTLFYNLQQGELIPPGRTEEEEKELVAAEEERRLAMPPDALLAEAQMSRFGRETV